MTLMRNHSAIQTVINPNPNLNNSQYFYKHFCRHPRNSLFKNLFHQALEITLDLYSLPFYHNLSIQCDFQENNLARSQHSLLADFHVTLHEP